MIDRGGSWSSKSSFVFKQVLRAHICRLSSELKVQNTSTYFPQFLNLMFSTLGFSQQSEVTGKNLIQHSNMCVNATAKVQTYAFLHYRINVRVKQNSERANSPAHSSY